MFSQKISSICSYFLSQELPYCFLKKIKIYLFHYSYVLEVGWKRPCPLSVFEFIMGKIFLENMPKFCLGNHFLSVSKLFFNFFFKIFKILYDKFCLLLCIIKIKEKRKEVFEEKFGTLG